MKKRKILLCILLLGFVFTGCKQREPRNNTYEDTYQLLYFYLDSCAKCQEVETEIIPLIEEEFGEHIEITRYNLDNMMTNIPYRKVVEEIVGFDEEDYGYGPFLVLEGYFAKLGLSSGDGEEFVDDLIRAVQGRPLGDELHNGRYVYKEKVEE